MRELNLSEMSLVSGANNDCPSGGNNDLAGIGDPPGLGRDIIDIYESLVEATSHIIERVANAL